MRNLRLGVLGDIRAGADAGRVVEVLDDASNTGGFLICTYADIDRSPDAFDSWVETIIDVEMYFDECGSEIEWVDSRVVDHADPPVGTSDGGPNDTA